MRLRVPEFLVNIAQFVKLIGAAAKDLLTYDPDHCGTGFDHVQFARRGTTEVNDPTTTEGAAIYDAHDDRPAVADICDLHIGAEG
jgi:hypothetical protein